MELVEIAHTNWKLNLKWYLVLLLMMKTIEECHWIGEKDQLLPMLWKTEEVNWRACWPLLLPEQRHCPEVILCGFGRTGRRVRREEKGRGWQNAHTKEDEYRD